VIERSSQIDGERLVGLAVEGELVGGAGLVPARIVVVPGGVVEA
jgi:hypothetical protein